MLKEGREYILTNKSNPQRQIHVMAEDVGEEFVGIIVLDSTYKVNTTLLAYRHWHIYEISKKGDYDRNFNDILAAQAMAVEIKSKGLFESYKRDLNYLGYKVGVS